MKTIQANLTASTTTTYGDTTKTYLAGRAFSKSINSQTVLGPPLTNFIDVFTDTIAGTSVTPIAHFLSPNGRLFVINAPATGSITVLLYNFDLTGVSAPAYVGRIVMAVPNAAATTHTVKQFEVYDGPNPATVTGWKIVLSTSGTVLINGGIFVANNIALADFVPTSPPTIGMAISSAAKAVYMLQDPGNIGVNNNITAIQGAGLDLATQQLYVNNNVLATTAFIKWDLTAALNVTIQTTTAATVSGTPTFTLTGHGYNNNDPVVLLTNVPTAFTATTATVQTVYFVRNAAANTFELSATSGGASINATSNTSATTIARAFGITTSAWTSTKTGIVTGMVGAILQTLSHSIVTPSTATDPNIPAGLSGQVCYFLPTASNFYLFKVSDILNGVTSFPSMSGVNVLGTGVDYTAIIAINAKYSSVTGRVVYTSNTATFYSKAWLSGNIEHVFGGLSTNWWENTPTRKTTNFAAATVAMVDFAAGWLAFACSTIGQRGIFYMDFRSDATFDYSYIVSPVLDTSSTQLFQFISSIEQLFDETNPMTFYYRTAATQGDAIFSSPTGGWAMVPFAELLTATTLQNYTQLKVSFDIAQSTAQTPAQVNDIFLTTTPLSELSPNWVGSVDNTTGNSVSPAKSAFRLTKAYASVVPTMYFRAYDNSGNLVISANTSANASLFEYSTNNGTSWSPLGTVPNVINTTELRYNFSTPPGIIITVSIRES